MLSVVRSAHRARVPASPADPGRPLVPRLPYVVAAGLVALLNGWTFAEVLGAGLPGLLIGALYALPVAVAWYRPLTAWWIMLGLLAGMTALGVGDWAPWLVTETLSQAPVVFTVALVSTRRVTAAVFLITLGTGVLSELWLPDESPHMVQAMLNWGLALLAVTVIGLYLRMRRLSTLRIAEEYGKRRLLEERARIARELHDLVAHHMSVIAVRAATAPYRIKDAASEEVWQEFRDINAAASSSLAEMRQLLGVLRSEGDDDPPTTPQPGLADLAELAESARRAGTPVRLELPERAPELGAALSLTVYRIVQEALSNVIKHAGGATARVAIGLDGGDLVVEVVNEAGARSGAGSGYGLVGMRERVSLAGGRLSAGATGDGRYAVRAVLPREAK
ncbi:sensor histidine kinase [Nonomuraea endophytica]|uniref:sensor histidine kinase n=1 Tax=Nonomuraea endophytica TaxID=714136 RepID=UPI0037C97E3D